MSRLIDPNGNRLASSKDRVGLHPGGFVLLCNVPGIGRKPALIMQIYPDETSVTDGEGKQTPWIGRRPLLEALVVGAERTTMTAQMICCCSDLLTETDETMCYRVVRQFQVEQ